MRRHLPPRFPSFRAVAFACLASVAAQGCAAESSEGENADQQESAYSRNQVVCSANVQGRNLHVNISRPPRLGPAVQAYEAYWIDSNPFGGGSFKRISSAPVTRTQFGFTSATGFSLTLAALEPGTTTTKGDAVVPTATGALRTQMDCSP